MKIHLALRGPLIADVVVNKGSCFRYYSSGVLTDADNCESFVMDTDHNLTLVGYDVTEDGLEYLIA